VKQRDFAIAIALAALMAAVFGWIFLHHGWFMLIATGIVVLASVITLIYYLKSQGNGSPISSGDPRSGVSGDRPKGRTTGAISLSFRIDADHMSVKIRGKHDKWRKAILQAKSDPVHMPGTSVKVTGISENKIKLDDDSEFRYRCSADEFVRQAAVLATQYFTSWITSAEQLESFLEDCLKRSWYSPTGVVSFDAIWGQFHFLISVSEETVARWEVAETKPRELFTINGFPQMLIQVSNSELIHKGLPGMVATCIETGQQGIAARFLDPNGWELGLH